MFHAPNSITQLKINQPKIHTMASFFDIRARKAAAEAGSSKKPSKQEPNRLQPWVEK
jgi:hypothetical protein